MLTSIRRFKAVDACSSDQKGRSSMNILVVAGEKTNGEHLSRTKRVKICCQTASTSVGFADFTSDAVADKEF